jgi:hypothetical protein
MADRNKRFDDYIEKSAGFAQPILRYLREVVHEACPEVEEEMKWSFPNFMYKGIFCSMAAFKEHCSFGFWKASLIFESGQPNAKDGMGHFGRITSIKDLPPKRVLSAYIKEAKRLNEEGIAKQKPKPSKEKKALVVPPYFLAAVKKNKKSLATFERFPYSHKKEYVEWVTEAKTEETRNRRLATTVEWLAEGKSRNWKYERC